MALPDSLRALLDPRAYPHPCRQIELIETHISWVILTGDFAYKLKKPVRFNFLDFSTLALRAHFCREEVRCNRSFAPELYLGVVAVTKGHSGLEITTAPAGEVFEWAVQMRQFDPDQALDRVLLRGELSPDELRRFGADLATKHAALSVHNGQPDEVPKRIFGPVEDSFSEIGITGLATRHPELFLETRETARTLGESLREQFDQRMVGGAVRECHGDLHLSNLALIDGRVTAFDCLEFNENLRWIDTISDVAFLFMDCHCRGEQALAYEFLDGYLDASADYEGACLLHYFAAYRSVVRAKVAALRWVQMEDEDTAGRFAEHLGWARDFLRRPPGRLVLTCGLSGSGKSYLAERLVGLVPAVRLRSDVARKFLAGLERRAYSGSPVDGGLYSEAQSTRTFEYLVLLARRLLLAGEHVIVDATFIERARREQFAALAAELDVQMTILYCDAPLDVLEQRLAARAAGGQDPSEATAAVLAQQQQRFQPPEGQEPFVRVDTTQAFTQEVLAVLVRAICDQGSNSN